MLDLTNSLTYLPGIGPQKAKLLETELGLRTFRDLLYYFPYKHIDRTRLYYIHELSADMPFVQIKGEILSYEEDGIGRKKRLIAHFTDGLNIVDLVWFSAQAQKWVPKKYPCHRQYIVFGRPGDFNGRINIPHPDLDFAESLELGTMGLQPYYHTTEKMKHMGVASRQMERFTATLLSKIDEDLPETLPASIIERHNFVSLTTSLRHLHYPPTAEALRKATQRQKFEELFFIQLNIVRFTRQRNQQVEGIKFNKIGPLFNQFYKEHLPFTLTGAQQRVVREMWEDMKSGRQMNRLLQGDVGSGKTLVALLTMLIALDNGYQACLLAPTEILAEQHAATIRHFLKDLPIRVELLTGNVKGKRKRTPILIGTRDGSVDILIGTHAILEDSVEFRCLGLAIIDEQHRFGVAQRARMQKDAAPHVLVMTATPIPRTLAMTLYGDLDVSIINELPPGRKPIETRHFWEEQTQSLIDGIRRQVTLGRQVYIVYPLIKESEKIDLHNLETGYEEWCQRFPDLRLSKVHGKMKSEEKDAEMDKFVRGETQILVSTTVIEVGVNVPNASVMIIMNAERFGLAQLHQLRGRVGRGADQSYCILVTKYALSKTTKQRIDMMCSSTDGFEIAEADLKLRGPGDLDGTQQSGTAFDLRLANLARDGQLIQLARDTANAVLDADPYQQLPEYQPMWHHLYQLSKDSRDWSTIL